MEGDIDDVLLVSVEKTRTIDILIELLEEIDEADEVEEVVTSVQPRLDEVELVDNEIIEDIELEDEVELEKIDGLLNVIIIDDAECVVVYLEAFSGILDEVELVEVQILVIVTYQNVELDDADDADEDDIEQPLVLEVP